MAVFFSLHYGKPSRIQIIDDKNFIAFLEKTKNGLPYYFLEAEISVYGESIRFKNFSVDYMESLVKLPISEYFDQVFITLKSTDEVKFDFDYSIATFRILKNDHDHVETIAITTLFNNSKGKILDSFNGIRNDNYDGLSNIIGASKIYSGKKTEKVISFAVEFDRPLNPQIIADRIYSATSNNIAGKVSEFAELVLTESEYKIQPISKAIIIVSDQYGPIKIHILELSDEDFYSNLNDGLYNYFGYIDQSGKLVENKIDN